MVELTRYTLKQVAQRDGKDGNSTWIVIHNLVYDVTNYKSGHPGGPELIDEYAGQNATSAFDDFGHSSDATRMLKDFLIGELVDEDKTGNKKKKGAEYGNTKAKKTRDGRRRGSSPQETSSFPDNTERCSCQSCLAIARRDEEEDDLTRHLL